MIQILHIIQAFSTGGAMRAALSAAKYSSRDGKFRHSILSLSPGIVSKEGEELCREAGVQIVPVQKFEDILLAIDGADIVQANWWNCPEMDNLFRNDLPPCRLAGWLHVGGHTAPQIVTDALVRYLDFSIACSPYTYECEAFQKLPADERDARTGMAYGAADFERLKNFAPKAHERFTIGYIGTVHFLKMHSEYVSINAPLKIPNFRCVVVGGGGAEDTLRNEIIENHLERHFEIKGYVHDVVPLIEEFDVYGYLLCEDTYAAAEVNLQEVMFAGIPPVVFPYGGIKHLVRHNETGLVVNTPDEYRNAVEFLYNNPAERKRLGQNAAKYAAEVFGAHNAAVKLNEYYEKMLLQPKRKRVWGCDSAISMSQQEKPQHDPATFTGSERFIESIGAATKASHDFLLSLLSENLAEVLEAEKRIAKKSELMKSGGVLPYRKAHQTDAHLNLWSGLMLADSKSYPDAITCFTNALNLGIVHWRVVWYLAQAAAAGKEKEIAKNALQKVLELNPEHDEAKQLLSAI